MGETVGGKSPEVSRVKRSAVNLEHFDTNLMGAANCGYMVSAEKRVKMDFKGVKIAWVDVKSKRYP